MFTRAAGTFSFLKKSFNVKFEQFVDITAMKKGQNNLHSSSLQNILLEQTASYKMELEGNDAGGKQRGSSTNFR